MTYEKAKELKEAGFIQNTQFIWVAQDEGFVEKQHRGDQERKGKYMVLLPQNNEYAIQVVKGQGEWAASPTLSELIEACGHSFTNLRLYPTIVPKKCECYKYPADWDGIGWKCTNCGKTNKCRIGGNVRCCPNAPHPKSQDNIEDEEKITYLKENRWEWEATGDISLNMDNMKFIKEKADTPEEAVSELWLALNKK